MEIKNKKETKNTLEFKIINENEVFANTLRRTVITNVPVFAVDEIAVIKNESPMYDETIAHRIAMIPFTYSDKYISRQECKCKGGCDKCSVILTLNKKGKSSVYSGDFKSSDNKVYPIHPGILITKLEENLEFNIEATAILGTLKDHAKFQNSITSISYEKPEEITFKIKSITGRKPKDLLYNAIDILKNKLDEIKKEVKSSKEF
ncbi:MAG: DNA-directed RNA polymerase subunit D [Candidatus Nanohalarchaeota archaeon]|nr:MAG: DNA-directed RNA polymerase subunit D [Candidatus Nanohaloarchaeota archaeon]